MMQGILRTTLLLTILPIIAAGSISPVSAEGRTLPATRLFQVIMIEAATTQDLPSDGIPTSALKALEDMRDFLPYKGYRFLDSALVRTANTASTSLKGPGGGNYRVDLSVHGSESESEPDLFFRRFSIVHQSDRDTVPWSGPKDKQKTYDSKPEAPRPNKELISTSFGMDVGETVIVGSSRLNGDGRALVLLVTALP